MTIASAGSVGTAQAKATGSSLAITTTATIPAGNLAIVAYATDNLDTSDGETSVVTGVTDSAGNTWQKAAEFTNTSAGAVGDGVLVSIWLTVATVQLNSGGTITITQGSDTNGRAGSCWQFTIGTAGVTVADYEVGGGESNTIPDISLSGLASQEYLFLHGLGIEGPNTMAYTEDGDYTSISADGTTGGGGATNISIRGGWRIATLTGDTVSVSIANNTTTAHILVAIAEAAAGPAYTLAAETGHYSTGGQDAAVLAARRLAAETGHFTKSGHDAGTLASRLLPVEPGHYAMSGQPADLLRQFLLEADTGHFTFTGQDTDLLRQLLLTAETGHYALDGEPAGLLAARFLAAEPGHYTMTGQAAGLVVARLLAAGAGHYTLTGHDATLSKGTNGGPTYILEAEPGHYAFGGQAADLLAGRVLAAETGHYTLTGQDAAVLREFVLAAAAGHYTTSGQEAGLVLARVLTAAPGHYSLTGRPVTFLLSTVETPDTRTLEVAAENRVLDVPAENRVFVQETYCP